MTKLTVLITDAAGQKFDCHGCTNCCRELVVHLTPVDCDRIDQQSWRAKLGVEPYVILRGERVLNHRPDGGCVFLQGDGRCRIHVEHGADAKPLACRMYPFSLEKQDGRVRAPIRFDCPSVARNAGRPLARHRVEIAQLAGALEATEPELLTGGSDRWYLRPDRAASELEAAALIDVLDSRLADRDIPLERRLTDTWQLVSALRAARLDAVREERFVELVRLLASGQTDDEGAAPSHETAEPTARQTALFRQAIFAHCEHLDLHQARTSGWKAWRFRLNQLRRARRFVRDLEGCNEVLGGVVRGGRRVTHAEVEAVAAAGASQSAECEELATRYVRQRLVSRGAFGHGYYGWPMLDGVAALWLSVAVAGWLGRYFAASAGRSSCEAEDFVRAIGVVDRAAGRLPELGSRAAKLRLMYLSREGGVLRLLRKWTWTQRAKP